MTRTRILALLAAMAALLGVTVVAAPQASALQTVYVRSTTCPIPGTAFMNNAGQVNTNATGTITFKVVWSETLNANGVVITSPGDRYNLLSNWDVFIQNNTNNNNLQVDEIGYLKLHQGSTSLYDQIAIAYDGVGQNRITNASNPGVDGYFMQWNYLPDASYGVRISAPSSYTNTQLTTYDPHTLRFGVWTAEVQDPKLTFRIITDRSTNASVSCWTYGDGVNNG